MRKIHRTEHLIKCEGCASTIKVFCQLSKGCYSQKPLDCPQCNYFTGWITTCPGYKLERLVAIIQKDVSGY